MIKRGLAAGATLLGVLPGVSGVQAGRKTPVAHKPRRVARPGAPTRTPNILTVIVDQLRTPMWMPPSFGPAAAMPNLASLRTRSVSFERHYTASNDCSPSRSVLLTGLYTHQTGVMITGAGWLAPSFPTWGTLLRKMGYDTAYYGKWHLNPNANASLGQYGFAGGTYPSPNGSPGQGASEDPAIAAQFIEWFDEGAARAPWATTVSFVNPHDIAWWHRFTERIGSEAAPPGRASALPPNYETPELLAAKGKPRLQRSLQETAAKSFGPVSFSGPEALGWWTQMMDTYLLLQGYVDTQIGSVLATLASRPQVAENTVVLFTSDHGEYGGSHGMRGKGASAYEEAIRVPLYVYDPRGLLTSATGIGRTQLTSSADVVALMLTIASGSDSWRSQPEYAHLASRLDLASICREPQAAGRSWIVHATDEDVTEFAPEPYAADAPRHVVALRSPAGKLALYSNWSTGTIELEASGHESEFYDYATEEGRLELSSQVGGSSALEQQLWATLDGEAIPHELRAPLPASLRAARSKGLASYLAFEEHEDVKVAEAQLPKAAPPAPEAL